MVREEERSVLIQRTVGVLLVALVLLCSFESYRYVTSINADHDLHEHIDLPGYYNGPMGAHGGNSKTKTVQGKTTSVSKVEMSDLW